MPPRFFVCLCRNVISFFLVYFKCMAKNNCNYLTKLDVRGRTTILPKQRYKIVDVKNIAKCLGVKKRETRFFHFPVV